MEGWLDLSTMIVQFWFSRPKLNLSFTSVHMYIEEENSGIRIEEIYLCIDNKLYSL